MNVGDPNRLRSLRGGRRESEMPIVVMITGKLKPAGAKGHYYTERFYELNLN